MKKVLIVTIASENTNRLQTLKEFSDELNQGSDNFGYVVIQDIVFRITDGVLGRFICATTITTPIMPTRYACTVMPMTCSS
jgi:hypothetical protein